MADSRIQDLPAIDALGDGDLFPVAREGDGYNARKVTAGQMTNYIAGVAQPYLTGAQEAASKAETASKTAVEAVDQIGTAVEDTRAAQKAAEAARDEAVRAGDGLSEIRDQTVAAAEQAQVAVEQITDAAESAEAAKQAAEAAQVASETARDTAVAAASQTGQDAQKAEQDALAAQTAKEGAEAAQEAIENLGVDANTLESGSPATVQKTVENGVVKLTFGLPTGNKGDKGDTGASMDRIEKVAGTGAPGTYDTYNVIMDNGQLGGQFQVYNGADGQGAGDMLRSMYDPQNKNTDVFAYIDQAVQNVPVPDVSEQIAEHNTDGTAHPDLRAELAGKEQAGAAVQALEDSKAYTDQKISEIPTPDVSAQIAEHNSSNSAHPDIRALVDAKAEKENPETSGLFFHKGNGKGYTGVVLKIQSNNATLTGAGDRSSAFHFGGVPVAFDTGVSFYGGFNFPTPGMTLQGNFTNIAGFSNAKFNASAANVVETGCDYNAFPQAENQNFIVKNRNISAGGEKWAYQAYVQSAEGTYTRVFGVKADGTVVSKDKELKSPYQDAVDAGYAGTEENFNAFLKDGVTKAFVSQAINSAIGAALEGSY